MRGELAGVASGTIQGSSGSAYLNIFLSILSGISPFSTLPVGSQAPPSSLILLMMKA